VIVVVSGEGQNRHITPWKNETDKRMLSAMDRRTPCEQCNGAGRFGLPDGRVQSCIQCTGSGSIGPDGIKIKVEGAKSWQVFLVAAGLIVLVFILLVVWRILFPS